MSIEIDAEREPVRTGDHEEGSSQRGGIVRSIQETARKFYSTTSSVYAEHTISNPNAEQILFWSVEPKILFPSYILPTQNMIPYHISAS